MTDLHWVATAAVLAAAGFAHGLFGIGFAMIATPLLALFLDYRLAVVLAAVPLLAMALGWFAVNLRATMDVSVLTRLLPGIAIGAFAGALLQFGLSEVAAVLLLAVLLSASLVIPMLVVRSPVLRDAPLAAVRRGAFGFGLLAGMTEAALNVGAPFMLLYGSLAELNRSQQLMALNACFGLGKGIQLSLSLMSWPTAAAGLPFVSCIAVSLLGYVAGHHFAGRFNEQRFRQLLHQFIMFMVLCLVARALVLTV